MEDHLNDHPVDVPPCGDRRASVCPPCAETYRADTYQLIRAGLAGGKGIPESVAVHPCVFATFTAPSFGPVHARRVRQHTCTDRSHCACRPQPCHARREGGICPHGRPLACFVRHRCDDPALGQALEKLSAKVDALGEEVAALKTEVTKKTPTA